MPRPVTESKLLSRAARERLKPRGKPYWRDVGAGLHLGYRKGRHGMWVARRYLGNQAYEVATIGTADDRDPADGKRVLSWAQAQVKAREWAAKRAGGGPLTLEQAIADYADDLRARKGERAAREAFGRMRKHLTAELRSRQVADLTTDELKAWRNGLVDADGDEDEVRRSRDTANRLLTILKAALNKAFEDKKGLDDRAWRVVKPFKDVGAARKVILAEAEIQRLLDACGPGLRELVAAGALTGARLGELTSRRVRDFDAGEAVLTVYYGKTRSREVHLPPDAAALLRQLASGKRPDDWLFTTGAGGRWTASLHARPFAAAVAKAGLDPDTVFYSLRHSYISRALKAGVPTKAVADRCGTSMAMLQKFYAKFIRGDMREYAATAAPALELGRGHETVVAFSSKVR
jgi:integrase